MKKKKSKKIKYAALSCINHRAKTQHPADHEPHYCLIVDDTRYLLESRALKDPMGYLLLLLSLTVLSISVILKVSQIVKKRMLKE